MRNAWLFVLLACPLAAEEGVDNIFAVWDANRDGVLTPDEIPDAGIFGKVDRDRDGRISRAEVAAFLGAEPGAKPAGQAPEAKADAKKSEAPPEADPRTLKERVDDFFRRFDADADGKIQRKELPGAGDEQWRRYDRTRDGALNRREAARYVEEQLEMAKRNPRPDNFLDLFDMNRDKRVTRKEYDGPGRFFREYDQDKDGVVTEGELAMGPDAGPMRPEEEMVADGPTLPPRRGLLERYDANKDERITPDELKAENVFRRLDENGDGVLSGSEVR